MSKPKEAVRSVNDLLVRASIVLSLNHELKGAFVEIARAKSPTAAFSLARATAKLRGFAPNEAIDVAKATRWLAMLRRDYGEEEFNRNTSPGAIAEMR